MTVSRVMEIRRSAATLIVASAILAVSFKSSAMASSVAVAAAVLLGGIEAAGATGLFILTSYFLNPKDFFSSEMFTFSIFIFISSVASGLISGHPMESEKKFQPKRFARIAVSSAAGIFGSSVGMKICGIDFSIASCIAAAVSSVIAALLLRPSCARFLYPMEILEKEADELLTKLNKTQGGKQ